METLLLFGGLILLWVFRKPITSSANLLGMFVNQANKSTEDTLLTHTNNIAIMNSETRSEQLQRINRMDTIVTQDEIADLLAKKSKQSDKTD